MMNTLVVYNIDDNKDKFCVGAKLLTKKGKKTNWEHKDNEIG